MDYLMCKIRWLPILLTAQIVTSFRGTLAADCPSGWVQFGRKCYWYSGLLERQQNLAQQHCAVMGGYVASIQDMEEQVFLQAYALRRRLWTGLMEPVIYSWNTKYVHHDSSPVNFVYWDGQPDTEKCATLRENGFWDMRECMEWWPYICSKNMSKCEARPLINSVPHFGNASIGGSLVISCKPGWNTANGQSEFNVTCTMNGCSSAPAYWTYSFFGCSVDKNECEIPNLCGNNSICTNVPGSFYCSCDLGYEWTDSSPLPNADDLASVQGHCEKAAETISTCASLTTQYPLEYTTEGSEVKPNCSTGYQLTPFGTAGDGSFHYNLKLSCIGEGPQWEVQPHPACIRIRCDDPGVRPHSMRKATTFYYQDVVYYTCLPGFQPSGNISGDVIITCQEDKTWSSGDDCIDIDECANGTATCNSSQTCINYPGSYLCRDNANLRYRYTDITLFIAVGLTGILYILTVIISCCRIQENDYGESSRYIPECFRPSNSSKSGSPELVVSGE